MPNTLVSVIIPVYNCDRYLAEAIESVLSQTFKSFEIIVVDDGSTDASAEIATSYKEVNYIRQSNQGIAVARNVGITNARGEFIAFIDADDVWIPNKLRRQVDYLINHPEIQYTVGRVKYFLEKGQSLPPSFRRDLLSGDHVGMLTVTLLVRKELFDIIGKFDSHFVLGDDTDWFARAIDANVPMGVIPSVLTHIRVHSFNISLNSTNNNYYLLKILRKSIQRKRNRCQ